MGGGEIGTKGDERAPRRTAKLASPVPMKQICVFSLRWQSRHAASMISPDDTPDRL